MKIVEHNQLQVDDELKSICREIQSESKIDDEWAEIQSCDMFQTKKYCGGYDAIEQSFWFSYYDKNESEWWFEISLSQIRKIVDGELNYLDLYEPDK